MAIYNGYSHSLLGEFDLFNSPFFLGIKMKVTEIKKESDIKKIAWSKIDWSTVDKKRYPWNLDHCIMERLSEYSYKILYRYVKWRGHCYDCEKDTHASGYDFYMVSKELWNKFGEGRALLCKSCFEKRLGREIRLDDLTDCLSNNGIIEYIHAHIPSV